MEPPTQSGEKGCLRASLIEKRRSLNEGRRRELSARVANALRRVQEYRRASSIMFYVAVRGEVETEALIRECLAQGKRVSVPCCDPLAGTISATEISDFDRDLCPGSFGIPEPTAACRMAMAPEAIGLFIVPGVGFDWSGVRLGWGKGCYDAFLVSARPRAVKVGLAYEFQLLPRITAGPRDMMMDMVVTEDRVLECRVIREKITACSKRRTTNRGRTS
jgi:5-formyltetrahydrofolate cyclo-ligase